MSLVLDQRLGFGTMSLGINPDVRPSRPRAVQLLLQAVEMGYTLFDTADSYCADESEMAIVESAHGWDKAYFGSCGKGCAVGFDRGDIPKDVYRVGSVNHDDVDRCQHLKLVRRVDNLSHICVKA